MQGEVVLGHRGARSPSPWGRETADDARSPSDAKSSSESLPLKFRGGSVASAAVPPECRWAEVCKEEGSVPSLREVELADLTDLNNDRPAARAPRAETLELLDMINCRTKRNVENTPYNFAKCWATLGCKIRTRFAYVYGG